MRFIAGLIIGIALIGVLPASCGAQQAPSDGGSMEDRRQRMEQMLDMVRQAPDERWSQQKPHMIDRLVSRIREQSPNNEAASAEAGKTFGAIFDHVRSLSDGQFEKQKEQLVAAMMRTMSNAMGMGEPGSAPGGERMTRGMADGSSNASPWIDVHVHLTSSSNDFSGAVSTALAAMDKSGIQRMIVMPPPQDKLAGSEYDGLIAAIRPHADRFAFLAGGSCAAELSA